MPLDLPESADSIVARAKADVQRELATSNPFGKNNWLGAIVTGIANRVYDFYLQLKAAIRDSRPDTAIGAALTAWAAIFGKQLIPASKASGRVVATGVAGGVVPAGTVMAVTGNGAYISTSSATISTSTVAIASLSRSGTTVTAVTEVPHLLASGVSTIIALAESAEYNGIFTITVTGDDAFQYEIVGTPADIPATAATATATTASVPIESEGFGVLTNLDAGTKLRLQSPIVDVDDTLTVDFGAVGGGTDQEDEDGLRSRTLDKIQNPVANFNVAAIVEKAKEVAGVTRVFVKEVTPAAGQVTTYFMRDNDPNPIPVASEVAKVKDAILTIKPANTDTADVIVLGPTAVPVNFVFLTLVPNSSTMQAAITANLRQFFDEKTEPGADLTEDDYRLAIKATIDTVTGLDVQSFTLSTPVGTIAIADSEIPTLGSVVYP